MLSLDARTANRDGYDAVDPHRLAELRSLALHRRVADEVRRRPQLVNEALARLDKRVADGVMHPRVADRWRAVLDGPPDVIAARIVAEDEAMTDLRQSTPFTFVVPARERWALWRAVREAADAAP